MQTITINQYASQPCYCNGGAATTFSQPFMPYQPQIQNGYSSVFENPTQSALVAPRASIASSLADVLSNLRKQEVASDQPYPLTTLLGQGLTALGKEVGGNFGVGVQQAQAWWQSLAKNYPMVSEGLRSVAEWALNKGAGKYAGSLLRYGDSFVSTGAKVIAPAVRVISEASSSVFSAVGDAVNRVGNWASSAWNAIKSIF